MTLENGAQATFRITKIKEQSNNLHINLEAISITTEAASFLQSEYISVGKIHKSPQPLIWSLITL